MSVLCLEFEAVNGYKIEFILSGCSNRFQRVECSCLESQTEFNLYTCTARGETRRSVQSVGGNSLFSECQSLAKRVKWKLVDLCNALLGENRSLPIIKRWYSVTERDAKDLYHNRAMILVSLV